LIDSFRSATVGSTFAPAAQARKGDQGDHRKIAATMAEDRVYDLLQLRQ
jgi:hypothetical protein